MPTTPHHLRPAPLRAADTGWLLAQRLRNAFCIASLARSSESLASVPARFADDAEFARTLSLTLSSSRVLPERNAIESLTDNLADLAERAKELELPSADAWRDAHAEAHECAGLAAELDELGGVA